MLLEYLYLPRSVRCSIVLSHCPVYSTFVIDHLNNFVLDKDHEIFSGAPIPVRRRKRLFGARGGKMLGGM